MRKYASWFFFVLTVVAYIAAVLCSVWAGYAFIAALVGTGAWAAYGIAWLWCVGTTAVAWGSFFAAGALSKPALTHADAVRKYRDGVVIEGGFRRC